MERLTEKIEDHYIEKTERLSNGKIVGTRMCLNKLGAFEDAEEKGLLKILPVTIGADIYFIPSKVNYDLNVLNGYEKHNRVYHQKVKRIVFHQNGWYLELDKNLEYGVDHVLLDIFYNKTWFTSEKAAQKALEDLNCAVKVTYDNTTGYTIKNEIVKKIMTTEKTRTVVLNKKEILAYISVEEINNPTHTVTWPGEERLKTYSVFGPGKEELIDKILSEFPKVILALRYVKDSTNWQKLPEDIREISPDYFSFYTKDDTELFIDEVKTKKFEEILNSIHAPANIYIEN